MRRFGGVPPVRPTERWRILGAMRGPLLTAIALGLISGCTEIGGYATDPDQEYVGEVAGSEEDMSFLRRGFRQGTVLHMTFDPLGPTPGTLTTSDDPCSIFTGATLEVVTPLAHDQLSLYDFPGGGRLRNFIYAVDVATGPLAGRNALAFVSLMDDKKIEVRIIAGAGQEECTAADCSMTATGNPCDFFGLFKMRREDVTP